jgi:hypothetical protein
MVSRVCAVAVRKPLSLATRSPPKAGGPGPKANRASTERLIRTLTLSPSAYWGSSPAPFRRETEARIMRSGRGAGTSFGRERPISPSASATTAPRGLIAATKG